MTITNVKLPNGLVASKMLNKFADYLDTKIQHEDLTKGFSVGFDGVWEYSISINNKGLVLKEKGGVVYCFIYLEDFENQPSENALVTFNNQMSLTTNIMFYIDEYIKKPFSF